MRNLISECFQFLETDFGFSAFDYGFQNRRYLSSDLAISAFFWDKYVAFDVHLERIATREVIGIRSVIRIAGRELGDAKELNDEARIRIYSSALCEYGSDVLQGDFSRWEKFLKDHMSLLQKTREWAAKFESMSPEEQYLALRKRTHRQPGEGGNSE